jgi:hypothetical protein
MVQKLRCDVVARAALGEPTKQSGPELLWRCPHHEDKHESLAVNPKKNVFMCGPCGVGGTPWQLAAFLARADPADKPAVTGWLRPHGLLNGAGSKRSKENATRGPVVAEFIHEDASGKAICRKRRHEPGANGKEKDYTWQRFEGCR